MYEMAEKYCLEEDNETLAILYSNSAICYDKHGDDKSVIDFTT